jgi:Plasmid pRiA4b ORF-3-like protein
LAFALRPGQAEWGDNAARLLLLAAPMAKSHGLFALPAQMRDINPPIRRPVQVEGGDSLRAAFGWADTHLHEFEIDDRTYTMMRLGRLLSR